MTATLSRPPPPRQHPHGWWEWAACRGRDPDLWITPNTKNLTTANKNAIAICRNCPVRQHCLDEAIAKKDLGVIRGGERMPKDVQAWTDPRRQSRDLRKMLAREKARR